VQKGLARFWIWAYEQCRKHLPEGYRDEIWASFIAERIQELQARALPDDYIQLLLSEAKAGLMVDSGREYRVEVREIRDQR